MRLILCNNSDDTFTYGTVVVAPKIQTEVMPENWYYLYQNFSFLKDLSKNNIYISDGIQEYVGDDANAYVSKAVQSYQSTITPTLPFAAKTYGSKKLYKRVVGIQQAVALGVDTTFTWVCTFPWVKFMAVEIMGGETGDTCSFFVLDTSAGTYSGVPNAPLNQFGFTANVAKDFYEQRSEFDADIYQGLQIQMVYHSKSDKIIGVNFVMNELK